MAAGPLRFADILTTASAVANYLGEADVRGAHLVDAVALLREEKTLADLGRALSPLVPRPRGREAGADATVKDLVQRWFAALGSDANAEIGEDEADRFAAEAAALT